MDARNQAGDMFGRHRTEAVIAECVNISAECVVKSLFKAVTDHAAGEEAFDDETVVAIRVKGESKRK
jgi:serine phosphatase RsbU (regulator of sigma subunit)